MNQLDHALILSAKGLSVIPVGTNKIPLIAWKDFQIRRATVEEILAWWVKMPDAQVGIVTGQISNLTVIDIEAEGDSSPIKDETFTVKTGGNGIHFYFEYDSDFRNMTRVRPFVDVRSEGGYVVAPGSRSTKGEYSAIGDENEMKVLRMSSATKEWLLGPKTAVSPYASGVNASPGFRMSDAFGVHEGSRNDTLHKLALSALSNRNETEESAWKIVVTANNTYNPPLPESEVRALFNSALKRRIASPPVNPNPGAKQPVKKQLVENTGFQFPSTGEDIARSLTVFREGRTIGIPTGFVFLDNIMGGLIPGQLYLLYADTNVGKSLFAVNIIVDLIKRGVKCLYFDLENSIDMTVERLILVSNSGNLLLQDWRQAQEERNAVFMEDAAKPIVSLSEHLYIWDLTKLNDRFGDISWEAVKKCIEEGVKEHAQVIVLDHLHFFSPAETDHGRLGEVAREISILAAEHGVSILVIAHTRKGLVYTTKQDEVKVIRPTIDSVMGSGLISKHFKNTIALKRNFAATEVTERQHTSVFVDKTKFGPSGHFDLKYDEQCLIFKDPNLNGGTTVEDLQQNKKRLEAFDQGTF